MSQFDEDGVIQTIFSRIGEGKKRVVEIGARIKGSNATALIARKWNAVLVESNKAHYLEIQKTYGEKHRCILGKANPGNIDILVPPGTDLLIIDIDGNDYWVWKALTQRPRVVCIEMNPWAPEGWIMPYNEAHKWNSDDYYGASARALYDLGREKDYHLIHCEQGTNLFFITEEEFLNLTITRPPYRHARSNKF